MSPTKRGAAAPRRSRKRQKKSARKPRSLKVLGKLLLFSGIIALCAWIGAVAWLAPQKITHSPIKNTHAFIVTKSQSPTILVASQGVAPATLKSLSVIRLDQTNHLITTVSLPLTLADNNTSAGEYLESGYDKELQQLVEQAIGVPITDYLIAPRAQADNQPALSVAYLKKHYTAASIGPLLPFTLNAATKLQSSASTQQLWQWFWYVRGVDDGHVQQVQLPDASLIAGSSGIQLDPATTDPVIQQYFTIKPIKDEAMSIVIKNATSASGLATLVSRFVSNMGGTVVAVEPSDLPSSKSTLKGEKASRLSMALTAFLGIPVTPTPKTGRERGDVELVLGSDVLNRLGK
jgi:hypothetical protein